VTTIVVGINPVVEALKANRLRTVWADQGGGARVQEIVALAAAQGLVVKTTDERHLASLARGAAHQGIAGELRSARAWTIQDLIAAAAAPALVLVLDGVEDPQNLGAILRTADAAGVHGVIRQSRRAAPLGGATARASAGALAHVRIAEVVNIARALDELKEAGIWVVGLASDAERRYDQLDLTLPTALVLGSEGRGLRRLVRERCDWLAAIPMRGQVASLNVSVAAAVVAFEALRQRSAARPAE
jgi:23S rRNA (guanosine2251-2'-O)-methyltransferase